MMQVARLLLGVAISGLSLWFLLNGFLGGVNVTNIMTTVESINFLWLSLAIGSVILSYPLNTMRLKYILNIEGEITCRFFKVLPIVWVSSFLCLIAPSAAFSDGIRATLLRATKVSNMSLAIRAVLVDRAVGLAYTLCLAGTLLLIIPDNSNLGVSNYFGLVFLVGFLFIGIGIYFGTKLPNNIIFFKWLRILFNYMHYLMTGPKVIVIFLGFAVSNALITALCLWSIAQGFSVNVDFWIFFLLTPVILIVNNLPIFYQGFGGREAAMLFVFGGSFPGMPPTLILTISLVSGFAMMVSALFGSLFLPFLLLRKNSLPIS